MKRLLPLVILLASINASAQVCYKGSQQPCYEPPEAPPNIVPTKYLRMVERTVYIGDGSNRTTMVIQVLQQWWTLPDQSAGHWRDIRVDREPT